MEGCVSIQQLSIRKENASARDALSFASRSSILKGFAKMFSSKVMFLKFRMRNKIGFIKQLVIVQISRLINQAR